MSAIGFQDQKFGTGRRVGNVITGGQGVNQTVRCTVCAGVVSTGHKAGATKKVNGGGGKNRFTFESAEHVRMRFNKTRGVGKKL